MKRRRNKGQGVTTKDFLKTARSELRHCFIYADGTVVGDDWKAIRINTRITGNRLRVQVRIKASSPIDWSGIAILLDPNECLADPAPETAFSLSTNGKPTIGIGGATVRRTANYRLIPICLAPR